MQCREMVECGRLLFKMLLWMEGPGKGLTNKPNLPHFVVYVHLDRVCLVDRHEYWAGNWNSEMGIRTNRRRTKTFVGRHNAEVFLMWPCNRPNMYGLVLSWSAGWKQSCWLLGPSLSILAYYFGLLLRGYDSDEALLWRTETIEFVIVAHKSFVATACEGIFMPKDHWSALSRRRLACVGSDAQPSDALDYLLGYLCFHPQAVCFDSVFE